MSTSWIIHTIIAALLLPPLSLMLLCALGLALQRKRPRLGRSLSAAALLLLLILSIEPAAMLLVRPLENESAPLTVSRGSGAQAIVILAGGRLADAPEYANQDQPNLITLGRVRYGAKLQRETGLPVLVTGGAPDGSPQSEAALMAKVLREEFAVPVQWVEQVSDDTAQNAIFSARLLRQGGARRILLVTDALHMPRARRIFERNGLEVIPAPTAFFSRGRPNSLHWLPSAGTLHLSQYALHEWIGLAWYGLRY